MEIIALAIILFVAVILQEKVFEKLGFKKLDYKCEFSVKEAYEGDTIYLVETIHNRKILPMPWLKAEITSSRWLEFAGTKSILAQESRYVTSSFLLKSYQKTTRRWKLKCLKRGAYTIGNVVLVGGDLLGYNTTSFPVPVNTDLIVYPEIVNLEELFIPANYLQGDTIVKRWVIDDPFLISGTREYTPRDSMNRIHWPATAKTGQLMVKKNDFTSQLSLTVILNVQSMENEYDDVVYKEVIEMGIKVAATMLDRALRGGIPVRLYVNGSTLDGERKMIFTDEAAGREHVYDLLKILAKLALKKLEDFEVFLAGIAEEVTNTNVILITAYLNEGINELARSMKQQRNDVTIIALNYIETGRIPGDLDIFYPSGVD